LFCYFGGGGGGQGKFYHLQCFFEKKTPPIISVLISVEYSVFTLHLNNSLKYPIEDFRCLETL
jgi:hypothetical protein